MDTKLISVPTIYLTKNERELLRMVLNDAIRRIDGSNPRVVPDADSCIVAGRAALRRLHNRIVELEDEANKVSAESDPE